MQRILQETMRRETRRATGRHPIGPNHFAGHNAQVNFDYELLALPEAVDDKTLLQQADGSFYFMAGFSSVSGPDVVE